MVMDAGVHELCTLLPGSKRDGHLPIYPQIGAAAANGFTAEELRGAAVPTARGDRCGRRRGQLPERRAYDRGPAGLLPTAGRRRGMPTAAAAGQPDDSEAFSDIVLGYINRMLMAEDIDEKFEHYPEHGALLAAEKPFLEILADQPASSGGSGVDSPDGSSVTNSCGGLGSCGCAAAASDGLGAAPDAASRLSLGPVPAAAAASSSFASSNGSGVTASDGFESLLSSPCFVPDVGFNQFAVQSQQAMHFCRVASKRRAGREEVCEVKTEKPDIEAGTHRGKKHFYGDDLDAEEGRCAKHSAQAIDTDYLVREMMDKVLLCNGEMCSKGVKELREALQSEKHSHGGHGKGSGHVKGRGKKQPKKEVVDLETLLIHCAQSVATDDRRSAMELLKQIRQHASPNGDGDQRLAHCFANGLEARLAGTGSQIYKSFTMTRFACTDMLKAYQLYLAACPFKKISHFFANQTIMNAVEKAKKVHIVDYGIYYGFQWPCLIQRLSTRPGGPPRLRITGIDTPRPGFRPAERIEETGKYLKDYAQTFNVPFEFQAIASRFEAVQIEDLHIEKDELLIVNCMFKFKTLMDESVIAESPKNMVLNTIRKMNPHVFIHGIMNGSYNAPFFVSRFREALFHYSAIFDMLETNIPRDNEQRLLIESALFGREAINVISCEGLERMERPETYKQWQVRNQRAGFKQLPMNQDIMKRAREKVRCYHKNFIIDEDNRWLLQGWKGRILLALSTWKPDQRSSS
ncbi:hypothetical protein PR202_gb04248 [Eleusine coracana subsp. coracana]|uniref:Scarecrow-like protein 9 n=1 Tax=Eleusine coracana subsp. coracana TaxID=191504 RepID=A0AAV5E436_ELECO|nr:hypothetical protein PR202_gb04248 [Eleusine coracana subsp. coracana]